MNLAVGDHTDLSHLQPFHYAKAPTVQPHWFAGSADPAILLFKVHPSGVVQASSLASDKSPYSQKLQGVALSDFYLVWHPSDPDRLVSLEEQGIKWEQHLPSEGLPMYCVASQPGMHACMHA